MSKTNGIINSIAQYVTDDQMRGYVSVMLEPFVHQLYKINDTRAMFRILLEVLAGGDVEVRDGKLYLDIEWLNDYMAVRMPEIVAEEELRDEIQAKQGKV